jgi:sensor histidine kinase regulating citrate/malate metabolism
MKGKKLQADYNELLEKYDRVLSEKSAAEYELSELKAAAESISRQDEEVRKLYESIRSIKHDMRNHLMVIASYLNSGDTASAKAYTSEILDKLNSVHSYIETGNSLMNHILNEKLNLARSKGIAVKAEIENLSFSQMESIDFSALLSNMLDNAVEASEKEPSPEIIVKITRKRNYETVLVKNRIGNSILKDNPDLSSSKADSSAHGMGVPQIKSVCEKYGGMCDFYEEDGFFCATSFIPV